MSGKDNSTSDLDQPKIYHIRIKGHLDSEWSDWFEGLTITMEEDGNTLLSGPVVDGAALHGLLKKVHDLGLPLLLVKCVDCDQLNVEGDEQQPGKNKASHRYVK